MQRSYARNTEVSPERSRAEIERLLMRFGADMFAYMTDREGGKSHVAFTFHGLRVRVTVDLPDRASVSRTPKGRIKKANRVEKDWEQEIKRRWRSLTLLVKSKLVAVADGVATFEQEFLPYIVWGDGKTTAERLDGRIGELANAKNFGRLLPIPGEHED